MNIETTKSMLGTDLSKRKYGLDILRALAIILVLLQHTKLPFPMEINKVIYYFVVDGVSVFFVLSGYLIGTILIKTIDKKDFTPKALLIFWVNRWVRTLPPYYFILILLFIISRSFDLSVQSYYLSFSEKLSYFLFLQNFKSPHFGFFAESWSLSVEEWFYIIVPLVLFVLYTLMKIGSKKAFVITIISIITLVSVYRFYSYFVMFPDGIVYDEYGRFFHKLVVARLDSIMFGVLGAFIAYFYEKRWKQHTKVYFFLGIFLISINQVIKLLFQGNVFPEQDWIKLYGCCFSFLVFSFGILFLLPLLSQMKSDKTGLVYNSITFISLISYSLYLLHYSFVSQSIMESLDKVININAYVYMIVYWLLSITLSTLMYKFIEKPSMDARKTIINKIK